MFKRLVATSRAPQIMVLSMLRSFGKIGPQIDQIWAWLSPGHRWSPGVRNPLKSSVTGPSLLVNCYLEIKFHKIIRLNPPPPLNTVPPHFKRVYVCVYMYVWVCVCVLQTNFHEMLQHFRTVLVDAVYHLNSLFSLTWRALLSQLNKLGL